MSTVPSYLTHYFERSKGPFLTLSDLPLDDAARIQQELRHTGVFAGKRDESYLGVRCYLERLVRDLFVSQGGRPQREVPFTMVLGSCRWFSSWYKETEEIRIPIREFDPETVSFTYGDMFPAMRVLDEKPHRGKVYRIYDLQGLVDTFGLPQDVNPDGKLGPERYIEAQVWSDHPIKQFVEQYRLEK